MLLITADSGYGKTTWMHKLRKEILDYDSKTLGKEKRIPLWIELPKVANKLGDPKASLLDQYLEDSNF
jgi:GTPase SAR1 family protein